MAGLGTGTISVGLDICKDIAIYLDAVKCRRGELASIQRKNNALQAIFTEINNHLPRLDAQNACSITTVIECLSSSEKELEALKKLTQELTGCDTALSGRVEKMKRKAKELTYAFDRQKLQQLEKRIDQTTSTLSLAMQNLDLNLGLLAFDKLNNIDTASSGLRADVLTVKSDISALQSPITELQHKLPAIETSVKIVGQSVIYRTQSLSNQLVESSELWQHNLQETQAVLGSTTRMELELQTQKRQLTEIQNLFKETCGVRSRRSRKQRAQSQLYMPPEQLLGRLVARPGNLKTICDKVTTSNVSRQNIMLPTTNCDETSSNDALSLLPPGLRCFCRRLGGLNRRVQRQSTRWGALSLYKSTETQQHLPGCPHWRETGGRFNQCVGIRFNGLAKFLGAAIECSFAVRSGAGGYGISPSFTYHPTVDGKTAPAFRIWQLVFDCCYPLYPGRAQLSSHEKGLFASKALARIIKLFQGKAPKASPLDVDILNHALVHHICYNIASRSMYRDRRVLLLWLQTLIDWGVPASDHDIFGAHPVEYLVRVRFSDQSAGVDAINVILQTQGQHDITKNFTDKFYGAIVPYDRNAELFSSSKSCAEAFGNGPLSMAVLSDDLNQVKYLLNHHPATLKEQNVMDQSPLHLAAGKPSCLKLLVNAANAALINQTDVDGNTPLVYAIELARIYCQEWRRWKKCSRCSCAECVVILLKSDCAITGLRNKGVSCIIHHLPERCRTRYLRHLKNRRDRLKQLALENLPFRECARLRLHDIAILDVNALEVTQLLQKLDIHIPQALSISNSTPFRAFDNFSPSIYDGISFNARIADHLFSLGFHDIDPFRDDIGYQKRPFIAIWRSQPNHYNQICPDELDSEWRFKHGADFSRPLAPSSRGSNLQLKKAVCTGHIALFNLAWWLSANCKPPSFSQWFKFASSFNDLFYRVIATRLTDNCKCKCSLEGCTPLTYLLKGIIFADNWRGNQNYRPELFLSLQECNISSTWRTEDHIACMRFLTFDALTMRHTCCRPQLLPLSGHATDSVDELEDDQVLSEVFEDWIGEFEEELCSRGANIASQPNAFIDFWATFWPGRMAEERIKLENAELSESERREAEKLGVVWKKPEVMSCEAQPSPVGNPYREDQLEYWFYELDLIAPEY